MPVVIPFKKNYNIKDRKEEAARIREKHPERIPVIITKNPASQLEDIKTTKYLFPIDFTIPQILCIIRQRITLKPNDALTIFVQTPDGKEVLPSYSSSIASLFIDYVESYKTDPNYDGYLYIIYSNENTFG